MDFKEDEMPESAYHAIRKRMWNGFTMPCYGERSLAEVVPTIYSILGAKNQRNTLPEEFWREQSRGCDKVVMLLVDGLGYDQVLRYRRAPFFDRFLRKGDLNPITTVFPSTTAAGVTTMHTGLTPQEHGLPEWNVYFEEFGKVIQTLPFKFLGGGEDGGLTKIGGKPEYLYNGPTAYEKLRENRIKSFIFMPSFIADTAYSQATLKGASVVSYARGSDLVVKLSHKLAETEGKAYFYVYWSSIDSAEHEFGPYGKEHELEIYLLSHLVTEGLFNTIDRKLAEETVFLMTADHGQINVTHGKKFLRLEDFVDLEYRGFLKKGPNGAIQPTGCPRDFFIFVGPRKTPKVLSLLKEKIGEYAEILYTHSDARRLGLFGFGEISERFRSRMGDILILPRDHNLLWNRGFPKDPLKVRGIHGGLSEQEMVIPFGAARLSNLLN